MSRAYEEVIDFIAAGPTTRGVADFQASEQARAAVADLIHRQKTVGLSANETIELNHYLEMEYLIRLAKARARLILHRENE